MAASKAKRARNKKAPAKKAPAPKKVPAKQVPAKKAPAKKAPAPKKAPAKKAPAPKKALAKKAPAPKKVPAKKAPAPKKVPAKKAPAPKKATAPKKALPKSTAAREARLALAQKKAITEALAPPPDGSTIVDGYMRDIDHPFKAEMQAVREIIRGVSDKISERIKWNAPSFYYKEDLGAFNPRATEYAHLILLFPEGKGLQEGGTLLEGNQKDRREAKFHSLDDVKSKKRALEKLIKSWLALRDA